MPLSWLPPFFDAVHEETLPGVWAKGLALGRIASSVVLETPVSPDEIRAKVRAADRPVAPRVTLWPSESDWFCDCGDRNDPCHHVVATLSAIRNETAVLVSTEPSATPEPSEATPQKPANPAPTRLSFELQYRLSRTPEHELRLERWLVPAGAAPDDPRAQPLTESLVARLGGIRSGRIAHPPILAAREDLAADLALAQAPVRGVLASSDLHALLRALDGSRQLRLDGATVRASAKHSPRRLAITAESGGFRLGWAAVDAQARAPAEVFRNGARLESSSDGLCLKPELASPLSEPQRQFLESAGGWIPAASAAAWAVEQWSQWEERVPIEVLAPSFPRRVALAPEVELELQELSRSASGETLALVPRLVYPCLLEIAADGTLRFPPETTRGLTPPIQVPVRDTTREKGLLRALQDELHLSLGQPLKLEGAAAVETVAKLRREGRWRIREPRGSGESLARRLDVQATPLEPEVRWERTEAGRPRLELRFKSAPGSQASPSSVLDAWSRGDSLVSLNDASGGPAGWAELPADWLQVHGEAIRRWMAVDVGDGTARLEFAPHELPEALAAFAPEKSAIPDWTRELQRRLSSDEAGAGKTPSLPADLRAELRDYQRAGVAWLEARREWGLGALLADDMGLGKTLQALCILRPTDRALILCPTSVLSSWAQQIVRFRPALSVHLYTGSARELKAGPGVTLASYGILRLDSDRLTQDPWDVIILDEAQTIRNPESQVARAAHGLPARFRLALTGTPVENRIADLWSLFQFLNPGLLGTLAALGARENPVEWLRAKIRPFTLRRLKRDVRLELPLRTEVTLHSELSSDERKLYDSLLLSVRSEVVDALAQGRGVMAALELLLRLRQLCCDPSLVPGHSREGEGEPAPVSSKLALLEESLARSIEAGHRALVFSQWTSLLDRVAARLDAQGIAWLRLDGSTRDRESVIQAFQADSGPPVLLLSLKAGGVGLTLTAADHVYLLDPWWNPAAEDQAADRVHRIGQTQPVLIHRLVARGTVEERILELQNRKRELARGLLDAPSHAPSDAAPEPSSLSREEILSLLAQA